MSSRPAEVDGARTPRARAGWRRGLAGGGLHRGVARRVVEGVGGAGCPGEVAAGEFYVKFCEKVVRRTAESVENFPGPVDAGGGDKTVDLLAVEQRVTPGL